MAAVAATGIVAAAWLASPVAALAPVPGGLYRGKTSERAPISLHVAADGRSANGSRCTAAISYEGSA